jgi:chorismate synthase
MTIVSAGWFAAAVVRFLVVARAIGASLAQPTRHRTGVLVRGRAVAAGILAAMGSSSGRLFRITTFGESHGGGVGVVIDGCPPRLALSEADIQPDLDRRRPGQSRLVTQRGVVDGMTLGSPIALLVRNKDQNSGAYDHMKELYRPSHADFTTEAKYGIRAVAGGGRASARETIGRVAAAAVARKLLAERFGVEVLGWVSQIHRIVGRIDPSKVQLEHVEASPTRCPDPEAAAEMTAAIEQARRDGDSLGGVVECVARGVPAGWGEPVFDKLEADLAKAVMSLPASKGFEVGSGFGAVQMTGREHNDAFVPGPGGQPRTATNHSGGIQGGISNGEDITLRVAFKPTATISSEQQTVTRDNEATVLAAKGRHDPCVLPRAVPLVEAAVLLVLADHWLRQAAIAD